MIWNAFLLALRELRRNVMRSFLTILGIVIGVAAVIVMVTRGSGATVQEVSEQIASLGSNLVTLIPASSVPDAAPPLRRSIKATWRRSGAISAASKRLPRRRQNRLLPSSPKGAGRRLDADGAGSSVRFTAGFHGLLVVSDGFKIPRASTVFVRRRRPCPGMK